MGELNLITVLISTFFSMIALSVLFLFRIDPTSLWMDNKLRSSNQVTLQAVKDENKAQKKIIIEMENLYKRALEDLARINEHSRKQDQIIKTQEGKIENQQQTIERQSKQILELNDSNSKLKQRLSDVEKMLGINREQQIKVLSIYPENINELQTHIEEAVIYNSGVDYRTLREEEATKEGIVRELSRERYSIIEIGAHGSNDPTKGIKLHDGYAYPGWWARVLHNRDILLVVLMACESDGVSDSLMRTDVNYVISLQRSVTDQDAIRFVRVFYENVAQKDITAEVVRNAVEIAKLSTSVEMEQMVRLRENI